MKPLPTFSQAAVAAFPHVYRAAALEAAAKLGPFVDDTYRLRSITVWVLGRRVEIPARIHFLALEPACSNDLFENLQVVQCLLTRSTDGYVRQAALRSIVTSQDASIIPFVVLLAGEYVIEIISDIATALPRLNREIYSNLVRENRLLMGKLRARATSYWDRYYRHLYTRRNDYPGLQFLHEIESWAL